WTGGPYSYHYDTSGTWSGRVGFISTSGVSNGVAVPPRSFEIETDSLEHVVRRTQDALEDFSRYDAQGLIASIEPAGQARTEYRYDQGRLATKIYGGSETTTYVYDLSQNDTRITDAANYELHLQNNLGGRLKLRQYGKQGQSQSFTSYSYTDSGFTVTRTEGS